MLENASNMIDTATTKATATSTASKASKITEILTSKTAQLTKAAPKSTTISALPPLPQTTSTSLTHTHVEALLTLKTRTSLKSLTSNYNTLTTSSLSSSSLFAIGTTETSSSPTSTTATLKTKKNLRNLTPAYLLTTLAAAIATHVKQKNTKSNNSNSNSNSKYSNCTNSKNIQTATASSKNVSCHMIQRHKDQNEFYHMLSLNQQNCSNVVQHRQQQEQQKKNRPQRQRCSNKYFQQQQKIKQFLLLLTCFVAIITIFSLPHLSMAEVLTSHMSTNYVTPTTKTIKSSTTATTHEKLILFSSSTLLSSTDNENKDDDNSINNNNNNTSSIYNNIADNIDNVYNLTSFSPLVTTIENSLRPNNSSSRQQYPLENHIITRLIRSLDVSVNGAGGGGVGAGSSSSSMFSPSPGGLSGLTSIFNQNLDTGLSNNIECPSFDESSACPCYKFEDGLFLECPGTTATSLRTTLERISSPIHSLSIYDFDRSVTSLSQDVFQPGVNIRHLQFSHSHLETLKENSLKNVRASLESLSIVNGKLTQEITTSL